MSREHIAPTNCLTNLKLVQIGKHLLRKDNLHPLGSIPTHSFLMAVQLMHRCEECENLPLSTVLLILQQPDDAGPISNISLDS